MAFVEVDGWPIERNVWDDYCPERKGVVPWATRWTEANGLIGREYPYSPGCSAYPSEILIKPMSAQTNAAGATIATYTDAEVTVKYSTKVAVGGGVTQAVTIEWIDDHSMATPVSVKGLLGSDGKALDEAQQQYVYHSGLVLNHVRSHTLFVPGATISTVDSINANKLYAPVVRLWFAAGTLLNRCPIIKRSATGSGAVGWYVHQKFLYAYNGGYGWNAIKMKDGTWTKKYKSDGTTEAPDYTSATMVLV